MKDKLLWRGRIETVRRYIAQVIQCFLHPTQEFSQRWMMVMILCSIYVSKDILYFGTINEILLKISQVAMIICGAFASLYLFVHRIRLTREIVYTWTFFTVIIVLSALFNLDMRLGYVYLPILFAVCGVLISIAQADGIYECFYKSMTVICVVSVIAFVIQKILPGFATLFPSIYNVLGHPFRFLVLTNLDDVHGTFLRNWGPFREPGVFQVFAVISLMYGLFRKKQVNLVSILFHILAIVTTFSTTGYIVLFLVVLAMIAQRKTEMHNWKLYRMILVLSVVCALYLIFFTDVLFSSGVMSYASVFGKLFDSDNTSMLSRFASIVGNVLIFIERPLFGAGISYVDTRFGEICGEIYGNPDFHNANTLFILLATFGLLLMIVAVGKIWFFINEYFYCGKYSKLLLFGAYLCLLFSENMMNSVIVLLPLFYVSNFERQVVKRLTARFQRKRNVSGGNSPRE